MVFALMGILALVFIGITCTSVLLAFLKNGEFLKKKWLFILMTFIILIELVIGLTSLPSNYILQRIIDIVLIVITVVNLFIYNKKFDLSRVILAIVSVVTAAMLFI